MADSVVEVSVESMPKDEVPLAAAESEATVVPVPVEFVTAVQPEEGNIPSSKSTLKAVPRPLPEDLFTGNDPRVIKQRSRIGLGDHRPNL